MQMYELDTILMNLHYSTKENWEQCRFNSYITAQCNSSKTLKPNDIIKFPWDNKSDKNESVLTMEDIERLKNKAEQLKYNL